MKTDYRLTAIEEKDLNGDYVFLEYDPDEDKTLWLNTKRNRVYVVIGERAKTVEFLINLFGCEEEK